MVDLLDFLKMRYPTPPVSVLFGSLIPASYSLFILVITIIIIIIIIIIMIKITNDNNYYNDNNY